MTTFLISTTAGRIAAGALLSLSSVGLAGCSASVEAAGPSEVPRLRRPSDEVRLRYCADIEQTERARATRAQHRDNAFFGFGWTLGTAGATTAVASAVTGDDGRAHALKTVALTTGVVGLVSVLTGVAEHWLIDPPKEHQTKAATAAENAVAIIALSDTADSGAAKDTADSKTIADTAFKACKSAETP
ncbi:MAG TPA: hypothetical protein VHB79_06580 [Polyangiaceae bacterium]|nr:hypothetical protein [Polyangiaceae bacterium]